MNPKLTRRGLIQAMAAAAVASVASHNVMAQVTTGKPKIEVWKDPNCGCCGDWVVHLENNGFEVKVNDIGNAAARSRLGVQVKYGSCHTALVGGYAIEGHVPAADILRLLKERPLAVGLAVPGMPVGSPGMDGEVYGNRRDPYDVLLLAKNGEARVFNSYNRAGKSA
jgi:hypothetical protein